jgi:hypothetical protein
MPSTSFLPFRTLLTATVILIALIVATGYVLYQARFLLLGPQVALIYEPSIIQTEPFVTLTGNATNLSRIWINGRQMYTDGDGNFEITVPLENGYTVATIEAEDRYGRTTALQRSFVYQPQPIN